MKIQNILINQTVAILCDGNNIERSIQEEANRNVMVNFDTLIPRLLNGRGLNRFIYFREGVHISDKLAERLYTKFYGSVVPCHKSADIPLSIKATQLASKVDTIIIMSGDSDYVELVSHLKSEGVRVEIAAVKKTSARVLLEEADYFHPITQQDWFSYNKQGNSGRQNRYPVQSSKPRAPPVPTVSKELVETPVVTKSVETVKKTKAVKPVRKTATKTAVEKIKSITKAVTKPVVKKKTASRSKEKTASKKSTTKRTSTKAKK